MLGGSFLLGGLKYHVQEFNRANARFQACLLFLATIAVLVPALISEVHQPPPLEIALKLSRGLAIILMVVYALGMLFSLRTHRELFASVSHSEGHEGLWPLKISIIVLIVSTLLVALVSEIFVGSVQA